MRVKATQEGFYVGRRRKGAIFDYDGKSPLPWMAQVPEGTPGRKAEYYPPEQEEPVALSELAKKAKKAKDEPEVLSEAAVEEPEGEPEFMK